MDFPAVAGKYPEKKKQLWSTWILQSPGFGEYPGLIRSLRRHLGISQKELAVLAGVSVGAVHLWETGKFRPKEEKKRVLVALRKLGRREVRKLLEEKAARRVEK